MTHIRTYSGRTVELPNPDPNSIVLIDIAAGLSHACRFAGQLRGFYSVAQHSCAVLNHVTDDANTKLARLREDAGVADHLYQYALLHDASEAYLGDMTGPLKSLCADYREIEEQVQRVILERFGVVVTEEMKAAVKEVDLRMCATEMRDMRLDASVDSDLCRDFPPYGQRLHPMNPSDACDHFMEMAGVLGIRYWEQGAPPACARS